VLSTCQRCIRTGVSDLSGQNNGARPSQGKQMVRNDHWSFDQDLEGVRSHRRRAGRCKLCSAATTHARNVGPLLVPWLRGTTALQSQERRSKPCSSNLEGVRSLGAVLVDASFVLPQQRMRVMLGLYSFHGCEGPQPSKVRNDDRSLVHRTWRASGPSAPCWSTPHRRFGNERGRTGSRRDGFCL